MASNILPLKTLLFLVCLSVLLPQPSVSATSQELTIASTNHDHQVHGLEIGKISAALSDKGYVAMSTTLQGTLPSLLPFENTPAFTIFCPPDKAFFTPKYPQAPPLTLIQYHIVPSNLDRESLESSHEYESKIDTLLHGHPLVVTTTLHSRRASVNHVNVTDWNIYDDGRVIVHGVEEFFDPAFQTLLYPWYDTDDISNKNGIKKCGVEDKLMYLLVGFTLGASFLFLVLVLVAWASRNRVNTN